MRILVDNSGYRLSNMGDVAMLQVAVRRLLGRWPGARVRVLTAAPDRLARFCPGAEAVLVRRPTTYPPARRTVVGLMRQFVATLRGRGPVPSHPADMTGEVQAADLVVGTGGGYLTDRFIDQATGVMRTLLLGKDAGKPIALLGQGLGPLIGTGLLNQAGKLFPALDLLALREVKHGGGLAARLGVRPDRVIVTGDDAVEVAHAARPLAPGTGLGVNLRVAEYSECGPYEAGVVAAGLKAAAARLAAPLVPLPVSRSPRSSDVRAIAGLLGRPDDPTAGGPAVDTPEKLMAEVARCRVVVTGSYHAAVFALSQGTGVVGLAKSDYYEAKFAGLVDQFGSGVAVVRPSTSSAADLAEAIGAGWAAADAVRPSLLAAAERQIAAGRAAYARLFDLIPQGR